MKTLPGKGTKLFAKIETNKGTLNCELFADKAPMTVANFVGLATGKKPWTNPKTGEMVKGKPFFDGLTFHRVIPEFMIQGGDPLGTGTGGPGYKFADEFAPDLKMEPGTLAMANSGLPATSGFVGEFMVILAAVSANFWLGATAATIMIVGAAYTLWMYKRVIYGAVGNDRVAALTDINRREFWLLGSVALLVLWMGLWPKPFIDVMHNSVADLLVHVAKSKL